jgi:hypothetical protein
VCLFSSAARAHLVKTHIQVSVFCFIWNICIRVRKQVFVFNKACGKTKGGDASTVAYRAPEVPIRHLNFTSKFQFGKFTLSEKNLAVVYGEIKTLFVANAWLMEVSCFNSDDFQTFFEWKSETSAPTIQLPENLKIQNCARMI